MWHGLPNWKFIFNPSPTMARTKITAKKAAGSSKSKIRPSFAGKTVNGLGLIPRIHASDNWMTARSITGLSVFEFHVGELREYEIPGGGTFQRYRIPVHNPRDTTGSLQGFLPMPREYFVPFTQLCYNIVYETCTYEILTKIGKQTKKKSFKKHIENSAKSASALLRHHLCVRRQIIGEILNCAGEGWPLQLNVFNEYIFKERFDLHWEEPHKINPLYLTKSPFDNDMRSAMGKQRNFTFSRHELKP